MESSLKAKFTLCEVIVSYKVEEGITGKTKTKIVGRDQEKQLVEFNEVSNDFVEMLTKACEDKKITDSIFEFSKDNLEAAVAIDLQDWIVSIESNTFGIRPDRFFLKFVEEYLKDLLNSTVPEKLTQSFQDLYLSVSLLKSLNFENKDIIQQLE